MFKKYLFLISLVLFTVTAFATHNRTGYISYKWITGETYQITITTCTKLSSVDADRDSLEIEWGDGVMETIPRVNQIEISSTSNFDIKKNIYQAIHTYPGAGIYTISINDPNRNQGISNILNSVNQPFCLQSELIVSPIIGRNDGPVISDCPCPEIACVNTPYCFNLSAEDPDGLDSLSFEFIAPRGVDCELLSIPQEYVFPDDPVNTTGFISGGGGKMTIDPVSGTLCWDSPQVEGEFNVAILVKEYRYGIEIGNMVVDLQLTVKGDCDNDAPVVKTLRDTCILAGTSLQFDVTAIDTNTIPRRDVVTLVGTGDPFTLSTDGAVFETVRDTATVTGTFKWDTNCGQVRSKPYQVFFTAEDDDQETPLKDIYSMKIRLMAPAVENLIEVTNRGVVDLSWDEYSCSDIVGYNIYRKEGTAPGVIDCCNGVTPVAYGFDLIGQNNISTHEHRDESGLIVGKNYCYVVTARYLDGAESCISENVCVTLDIDLPVMTIVSVDVTDETNGGISVNWTYPRDLDTLNDYTGDYSYKLYRIEDGNETLIHTTSNQQFLINGDTIYVDQNLNTLVNDYSYRVELFDNDELVGTSSSAHSVVLAVKENDNKILISWQDVVPWNNNSYEIFRQNENGVFISIGTTSFSNWTDDELTNGVSYCYKIQSTGRYDVESIRKPLINWSQEICGTPIDLTPPCAPSISIENDCNDASNILRWNNPNNSCSDDVVGYRLFYSPNTENNWSLLEEFNFATDTTYEHLVGENTIAGCYVIVALDSVQYGNVSDTSNRVCIDNCPFYFLPNIFTPDGDLTNELFVPLEYQSISEVNIKIFNRWGNLVFEGANVDINWDGKDYKSGRDVTDGVYYYQVDVKSIRLHGIVTERFSGFITLARKGNSQQSN